MSLSRLLSVSRHKKQRRSRPRHRRLTVESLEPRQMFSVTAGWSDPTFDSDGLATLSFERYGDQIDTAADVAVQRDGKMVVVGSSHFGYGEDRDFAVARFNSDGSLDAGFGRFDGFDRFYLDLGGNWRDDAEAVAIDQLGRILIAGSVDVGAGENRDFAVLRLHPDGRIDHSFGNDGKTVIPFDLGGHRRDEAHDLVIDPQGRILVAGTVDRSYWPANRDYAVARLTAEGDLDVTFGSRGKAVIGFNYGGNYRDEAHGLALDSRGRIIVAGSVTRNRDVDFGVTRLTDRGQIDTTFGWGGRQLIPVNLGGTNEDVARSVEVDQYDRIIVAGTADANTGSDFAVARLTTSGNLDYSFGSWGRQTVSFDRGTNVDVASDVTLDHYGRIIIGGASQYRGGDWDIAAARLLPGGQLDSSFSARAGAGRSITYVNRGGTYYDAVAAVAVDREGRILLAGQAHVHNRTDFALVRLDGGDSIQVVDASGDATPGTAFRNGAVRVSYNFSNLREPITSVNIEALRGRSVVTLSSNYKPPGNAHTQLIDLRYVRGLAAGDYQIRVRATLGSGRVLYSSTAPVRLLEPNVRHGTHQVQSFLWGTADGSGIFYGSGGTDTLWVGVPAHQVVSINGLGVSQFVSSHSAYQQAIHYGSAFDHIVLADGREAYFQGVERLWFADNAQYELIVRPDDVQFNNQWNLHIMDVPNAWRHSTGSENVLLVSLDTGVRNPAGRWINVPVGSHPVATSSWVTGNLGGVHDLGQRVVTDAADDENSYDHSYGHGHSAISIMAASADNRIGIAGINWKSDVIVNDVYGEDLFGSRNPATRTFDSATGIRLHQAIKDALRLARNRGQRVIFQGGVQGENWLSNPATSGGTQQELQNLIAGHADAALFAMAAGNHNLNLQLAGGIARLAGSFGNVMAIGAVAPDAIHPSTTTVYGMLNHEAISRWSDSSIGSNFGSELTVMGPAEVPAINKFGFTYFGGTSAANPHAAAVASLVWSANPVLTAPQVREIISRTAMDLGVYGRDDYYGYGLMNADAAVRRAVALGHDPQVANLWPVLSASGRLVPHQPPSTQVIQDDATRRLLAGGWDTIPPAGASFDSQTEATHWVVPQLNQLDTESMIPPIHSTTASRPPRLGDESQMVVARTSDDRDTVLRAIIDGGFMPQLRDASGFNILASEQGDEAGELCDAVDALLAQLDAELNFADVGVGRGLRRV